MLARIEAGKVLQRGNSRPAAIHVRLRFEDADRKALPVTVGFAGPVAPAKLSQLPPSRQMIGETESGVVSSVLVLGAGISQPHDRVQIRPSVRLRPRRRASASE